MAKNNGREKYNILQKGEETTAWLRWHVTTTSVSSSLAVF